MNCDLCISQEEDEAAERRLFREYLHPEQVEEERGALEMELKEQREEKARIMYVTYLPCVVFLLMQLVHIQYISHLSLQFRDVLQ
jgi:hypothetical protein